MIAIDQILEDAARLNSQGDSTSALHLLEEAVKMTPGHTGLLHELAQLCRDCGDHVAALKYFRRLEELCPNDSGLIVPLGIELAETGDYRTALDYFNSYFNNHGENASLHLLMGICCGKLKMNQEAQAHFEKTIVLAPSDALNHIYLGAFFVDIHQMEKAEERLLEAIRLAPNNALAYNNLGRVYKFQGKSERAVRNFRRALELDPENRVVVNNLLLNLNYLQDMEPAKVFEEHRSLCARVYPNARGHRGQPVHSKDKLRIGYVSGDFHNHSVAYFLEPVLQKHDRQQFEIFCYSNDAEEDETTLRLMSLVDIWKPIIGLNDESAADLVAQDGIDILIDLAGHTLGNRLGLFALKPAPVQVSWIGYPHSTGLAQMDYYITDALCDPPGMTEEFYTERLVRLPAVFCCYLPPGCSPDVTPPPCTKTGIITFGSFNNFAKVNKRLIRLWAEIMGRIPGSRLLLKSISLGSPATQREVLEAFAVHGISADRIAQLSVVKSSQEHLALYSQVDIALDTYPYHGTTTTCEAMWMGVPVVTLAGNTHASRVGVSLLTAVGCPDLIAHSLDMCVEAAVKLASDVAYLCFLRDHLRKMLTESALMDSARLVHDLEAAFHEMQSNTIEKSDAGLNSVIFQAEDAFKKLRLEEAEALYRQLSERFPFNPKFHNDLATVLDSFGRYLEAAGHYTKALFLDDTFTAARFNLANTLKRLGDTKGCEENLRVVVEKCPDYAEALQNLGLLLSESGRLTEAIPFLEKVVAGDPSRIGGWAILGELHYRLGTNLGRALECFDRVLEELPDNSAVLNSKGLVLHEQEDYSGAENCFREALRYSPNDSELLNNLGLTFLARSLPDPALDYFNQALMLKPGEPSAAFNRGMALLVKGDFERGWPAYEQRFHKIDPVFLERIDKPYWQGEPLNGRTLLVRSEQGYGDAIQFSRYLAELSRYCGRIVFECHDRQIAPLFANLSGVDELVIRGDKRPEVDLQVPLLSLPLLCGAGARMPGASGYLKVDLALHNSWGTLIHKEKGRCNLAVGIVWGGRQTRLNADRSVEFSRLAPLFNIKGIKWFSLQVGPEAGILEAGDNNIVDLGSRFTDFTDTAACISSLDLVITIDSAVAHLTGALGVPVWILLKLGSDWRWLIERSDSPWYSSARLFRREQSGGWDDVITTVADALQNVERGEKSEL